MIHCGVGIGRTGMLATAVLCRLGYDHNLFPELHTFQFGGQMPWWEGDAIEVQCPDPVNLVTLRLERSERE